MTTTPVLLDTHAWLWLLSEEKISHKVLSIIEAAADSFQVHLSEISFWEVAMLAKKNRVILGQPTLSWIQHAIKGPGTQVLSISPEIAVESTELPGEFHGDPADRILVATARIHELTLITRDEKILEYEKQKRVQAIRI